MINGDIKTIVSIIAPVFNTADYLPELLESIINQTFVDWEFLLVDDGSTDDSVRIIQSYSLMDNRIKLIVRDREPKSAQTCRNIGIKNAIGKYIIVIDSDDCVGDSFLEQRVEYMENNPDIDYATFKGLSFRVVDNNKIYEKKWGNRTNKNLLLSLLSVNYPFGVWNNIYRKEVFDTVLFDENVHVYQDFDFMVRVVLNEFKHDFCDYSKNDYFYRRGREGAITASFVDEKKYVSTNYLLSKISSLLRNAPKSKKNRKAFLSFYLFQFRRILLSGTSNQSSNFFLLLSGEYKDFPIIRAKIAFLKHLVRVRKNKALSQNMVNLFFNILFFKKKFLSNVLNK